MKNGEFEMLLSDALEHEDLVVRSEALGLLAGGGHANPDSTIKALRQVDRYGWEDAFEFSHQITDLPLSVESMAWLANRLEKLAPDAVCRDLVHLGQWFCGAPLPLVEPHVDRFLETVKMEWPPKTGTIRSNPVKFANPRISFDLAARRLEAAILSPDQCLERLERCLDRCAESPQFPHEEIREMKVLCEALGNRNAVSMETLCDWLDAVHEVPEGSGFPDEYRSGAALLILKHGRNAPPVDPLLRLYELDWDWYNEQTSDTLASTGDARTLALLLKQYPGLPWNARLFLTGVFEKLRFPEHESKVIGILENETDNDLRADLCLTLVLYGSENSVAVARKTSGKLMRNGELVALEDALCIHDLLRGEATVATQRHLEQMRRRAQRSQEQFALLGKGFVPGLPGNQGLQALAAPSVIIPFRSEPDVGRNSPCPCGSGKKFKKCCGG